VTPYAVGRDDDEAACRAAGCACRESMRRSVYLGWAAELGAEQAVQLVLPPEDQGTERVQYARPRARWRLWWMAGWETGGGDDAR